MKSKENEAHLSDGLLAQLFVSLSGGSIYRNGRRLRRH